MIDTTLDIALEFLAAHPNWYIFPIQRLEKKPPLVKSPEQFASNNPKQIKAWHQQWRGCNWGINPAKSKLVPLDIDTKTGKVGQRTLDDLLLEWGELPDTLTVQTPSGGLHYYFNETDLVKYAPRLGEAGFGLDIDVPMYLVIPGCVVCSNIDTPYKIIRDVKVADAPEWFANFIKPKEQATNAEFEAVVDLDQPLAVKRMITYLREGAPNSIQGQGGDKTMFDTICVLKDEGISEAKALELLTQFYNVPGKCVPLWSIGIGPDADRLDKKVANVYRYARENKAGSASAEFAFGRAEDKIEPAEVEAFAASWKERLAKQTETKAAARRDTLLKKTDADGNPVDEAADADTDDAAIDPLTGEPYEPGVNPDDDPPPTPTKPKKKAEQSESDSGDSKSANDGTDDRPDGPDDEGPKGEPKSWIYKNWVWIVGLERFVRVKDSRMWSRTQFDSRYNNLAKVASMSAALFKSGEKEIRRFDSACFRPGRDMILGTEFNLWRPGPIVPEQGDTSLWDAHLELLFPNEADRNHVLNWLAWVYQNQTSKPNHALLIVGKGTGTGKSFVARVMEQLIGAENTQRPKNSSLKGDFNGWALRCKLCIIEELMQIGRREVANELRDIITEPTIEVNIKNVPAQLVENYMAMMAVSNHPDAMPIDETDRRWLVIETPVTIAKRDELTAQGYYLRFLREVIENPKALSAIAYALQNRDLKGYSAASPAPFTDAKREMIELSRSEVETWLWDNMDNAPMTHRVFGVPDIIGAMTPVLQKSPRLTTTIINFLRDKAEGSIVGSVRLTSGVRMKLWARGKRARMMESAKPNTLIEWYEADRKSGPKGKTADELAAEDFGTE